MGVLSLKRTKFVKPYAYLSSNRQFTPDPCKHFASAAYFLNLDLLATALALGIVQTPLLKG